MMKSTTKLIFLLFAIAVPVVGVFTYHEYDKHHISSDLRRTLTAACDPSASDNDISFYVRDARLQVHTTKDAGLLAEFQEVIALSQQINELNRDTSASGESTSLRLGPGSDFDKLLDIKRGYAQRGQPIPKSVDQALNSILADEKERIQARSKQIDLDGEKIRADSSKARTLIADIKKQLGLSPN